MRFQRPQGAWQPLESGLPAATGGRGSGGRGGTGGAAPATQKQPSISGYAAAAAGGQGPGPRYGAPAGPTGAEGRASMHHTASTSGAARAGSGTASAIAGTSETSSSRGSGKCFI